MAMWYWQVGILVGMVEGVSLSALQWMLFYYHMETRGGRGLPTIIMNSGKSPCFLSKEDYDIRGTEHEMAARNLES